MNKYMAKDRRALSGFQPLSIFGCADAMVFPPGLELEPSAWLPANPHEVSIGCWGTQPTSRCLQSLEAVPHDFRVFGVQRGTRACGNNSNDSSVDFGLLHAAGVLEPEPFDVLLGKGPKYTKHPGNQKMQVAIELHQHRYNMAQATKAEKTKITDEIIHFVKCCGTNPGRFLTRQKETGLWVEVDDFIARQKVTNALRYTRRRSSSSQLLMFAASPGAAQAQSDRDAGAPP
jgi:hypothetical protein